MGGMSAGNSEASGDTSAAIVDMDLRRQDSVCIHWYETSVSKSLVARDAGACYIHLPSKKLKKRM